MLAESPRADVTVLVEQNRGPLLMLAYDQAGDERDLPHAIRVTRDAPRRTTSSISAPHVRISPTKTGDPAELDAAQELLQQRCGRRPSSLGKGLAPGERLPPCNRTSRRPPVPALPSGLTSTTPFDPVRAAEPARGPDARIECENARRSPRGRTKTSSVPRRLTRLFTFRTTGPRPRRPSRAARGRRLFVCPRAGAQCWRAVALGGGSVDVRPPVVN